MSSATWTPAALSSERRGYQGEVWRLVEAQHIVSTLKLVDHLDEQDLLEDLIEAAKPPVPNECAHLHYLLSTPFRYSAVYPAGSRFRRAGRTPGVFYAAETVETALAETAFVRLLFFMESPGTPRPKNPFEFTAFTAEVSTDAALDLTIPPLSAQDDVWTDPTDYAPCQDLADSARAAGAMLLRYTSVRDAKRRANVAVLDCRCFKIPRPIKHQTWRLRLGTSGVQALCEFPRVRLEYPLADFANDPRVAALMHSPSSML